MLTDRLDPRRNSLNAIRLLLALLVVVSHAWPLNGFPGEPNVGGLTLGGWAVLGFFGISGYLITTSRMSLKPALDFWLARAARILPGLLVALIVVAFVFAPIGAALESGAIWSPSAAFNYVVHNVLLYPYGFYENGIPGTLNAFQYHDWDGPLWTLFWEGLCYVLIGLAVTILGRRRALRYVLAASTALLLVGGLTHKLDASLSGLGVRVVPMLLAFLVGALLAVNAKRVPVNRWTVGVVSLLCGAAVLTQSRPVVFALLSPFLFLVLGAVLPLRSVGRRIDLSYGLYIYAWPVQQLLVLLLGWKVNPGLMVVAVVAATVPLAFLSSVLVERPSMRLKARVLKARRVPIRLPEWGSVPSAAD